MALSNQVPMQAKMKPLPPPKPISPQNQKILMHPQIDVQSPEGHSSGSQNVRSGGPAVALRGRPANDSNRKAAEEKSGDSHGPIKPSFKPKYLPDEVKSRKLLVSSDSNPPVHVLQQLERKTKPPLLPKPAVGRLSLQTPKPPVPKRPCLNPLARRNVQESGTQTNDAAKKVTVVSRVLELENSAVSRSGFSSLQHFQSVGTKDGCDNPVRPPRSPKNKPFLGMPFDFISQQVVNSKQKNLSLPQSARQNAHVLANWEHNSAVSHNEEVLINQRSAREKACSLGRSISLFSHEHSVLRSYVGDDSKLPVPPPRRAKKKSDFEANSLSPHENVNIPVYASVNYELKKNRRSQVLTDLEAKNLLSNHGSSNIESAEASLFETNSQTGTEPSNGFDRQLNIVETPVEEAGKSLHSVIAQKDENFNSGNLDSCKDFASEIWRSFNVENRELKDLIATSFVMEETLSCDNSLDVCSSHIIEKDCHLSLPVDIEASVMDKTGSYLHNECSKESKDNKLLNLESSSKEGGEVIIEGFCAQVTDETCDSSRKVSDNTNRTCDECESKNEMPTFDKEVDNSLVCHISDKIDKLKKVDLNLDTTHSEGENTSTKVGHCTCESLENNGELREFLNKMSCGSYCSLNTLEKVRIGNEDDLELKRNQSASLPLRSKLNPVQCRDIEPCRRQSWCDGQKKENSSSSTTSSGKQSKKKKKSQSHWCDEGDLSSGHLGDQSSFEDVPMAATGDMSPVCRRFSAIFSSFGKSSKKPRKQAERAGKVISRFYCSSHDENLDGKRGESAGDDKGVRLETESSTSMLETESGEGSNKSLVMEKGEVSSLCVKVNSLDLKRKSDEFGSEHLSEGSYENAPSESDNEDTLQLEEKLDTSLTAAQRRERKAFYIAQELMTSERAFVDVLRLLCIDFGKAVIKARTEEKSQIITEEDLGKILNNLPHLLSFNEDLLHDLEDRINNWSSNPKIADIIVRKGPFLKLYTSYFLNFETQCQLLDVNCESNPRFAKVVRDFEASPRCQKLAVKHYMLKPIQRVPQYRLLLEDYLAHLETTSDDYDDTQVALKIVCDVAEHANKSMKQGDTLTKLLQLQSLVKDYVIVKPGRTFLKEGELQKLCRKGMQSRYFILLNDCLLYATYDIPGSLKVNYELPLSGMRVEIPVAEDYTNEFSIISVTRSFTLSASSAQERCEWVSTLRKAIQDHTSRQLSFLQVLAQDGSKQMDSESFQLGTAAPVWIQDCRVTMCQLCTAEFTVTFRRHHCRACGKVVCGICSANKAPLQYMKFQTARVCDECYQSLYKDFDENQKSIQEVIQNEICSADFADTAQAFKTIKASFKKLIPTTGRKAKRFIPQRLKEVCANDTGSQMSGWLHWRDHKSWKKNWFVLKEQVLYVYKASEDVVALKSIPILGCEVSIPTKSESLKDETDEAGIGFILTHKGRNYLEFQADNVHSSKRWISAMQEATVLK